MPSETDAAIAHKKYRGEAAYIYAFDIAYDMKREPIAKLLGEKVTSYTIGTSKRSPKQLFFYQPATAKLLARNRLVNGKTVAVQTTIKVFSIGAVSVQIRVPFEVDSIEELVSYHELSYSDGSVEEEARQLVERARTELADYCIGPVEKLGAAESYSVFCIHDLPSQEDGFNAENWLKANRRAVAGLLVEEENAEDISDQEVNESTEQYISYYAGDLVVVDWDASLVIGEKNALDDLLHITEVANVQLVELGAYDRLLDVSLEKAYLDMSQRRVRSSRGVHRSLREIRIDLARFSDELSNITKFFGDWHLARIYTNLSNRFHLGDWYRVIHEKLKILADLYQLLQQDWINFWMVILEMTIVLLFILDVILLLLGL